ncbi:MAG: glycosyltransferase 87 family protein, partial [Thermoanaerobaculia bacterium]
MDVAKWWRVALWALVAVWVLFAVRLMIADVWDETNGMLAFSSDAMTLTQKLQFVLTKSLGFWRPLPTLLVTVILHFARDFDVSWRILRSLNVLFLLGAVFLFLKAVPRNAQLVFTIAVLFSGSAVITAGWYANIFDASVLLLTALATVLLLRKRAIEAGIVMGIAFFCKETAILTLPFLLILFAARQIPFRDALRAG